LQGKAQTLNPQFEVRQMKPLEEHTLALEIEVVQKEKTERELKRLEKRSEGLSADLKKATQEKTELYVLVSAKEEELRSYKQRAAQLEESLAQQSSLDKSQRVSRQQCFDTLKHAAEEYRAELEVLQKTMQTELVMYRKFMQSKLTEVLEEVEKSQEMHRLTSLRCSRAQEAELREAARQLDESEVQAESKVGSLTQMIRELERRLQSKEQEVTQHTRALMECRSREESLLHEKAELAQMLKSRDDTIENMLQDSILERERLEHATEDQIQLEQQQSRKQLESLGQAVESLKAQHSQELKRYNEMISQLQTLHRQELTDLKSKHQHIAADREREVSQVSSQLHTFREELELVEQEVTVLRRKVDSVFSSLEGEVKELMQEAAEERRKSGVFKTDKLREIEELRRQLRQVGV
jgi:DNA repair exonuclease SbcCD ATPase subunit